MENGPSIDGLPNKTGDFHGYVSHNHMVPFFEHGTCNVQRFCLGAIAPSMASPRQASLGSCRQECATSASMQMGASVDSPLAVIQHLYYQKGYGPGTSLIPSRCPKLYSGGLDRSTEPHDVPFVLSAFDFDGSVLEASFWWFGSLG